MKNIVVIFMLLSYSTVIGQSNNTTYSGKITGFNPSWNFNSGNVIVNNVVTNLSEIHIVPIDREGNFSTDFFLDRNQECWISFPFFNSTVYFGRDKHIVQDFDVADPQHVTSVFKGDYAQINNDMNKARSLFTYDWDLIFEEIYNFSADEYKDYFIKIGKQKIKKLDSIREGAGMSKKAYDLAKGTISYSISSDLIAINSNRETASRLHDMLPFDKREPLFPAVKLDPTYYSFLKNLKYNDSAAMEVREYFIFVNRLKWLELITDQAETVNYTTIINQLKQTDTTDSATRSLISSLQNFMDKKATIPGSLEKTRALILPDLLNTDITLELQLMALQDIAQELDMQKIPLSDDSLKRIESLYKDPYLYEQIVRLNNKIKEMIDNNKPQEGSAINTISREAGDRAFEEIIDRYKGKILFIDFWATWCAPCLGAIREIANIKAELKEDVVFLYITNDSSPVSAYEIMTPSIEGEHYRLTAQEYAVVAERFNIVGIPHYVTADRTGKILEENFRWSHAEGLKRKLIQLTGLVLGKKGDQSEE